MGDCMKSPNCDPLALTMAVSALASSIAAQVSDEELGLIAAVLTQLGDTLGTIAAQRELCNIPERPRP